MNVHLYLSMTPESLVASQLPPREFGGYLAIGSQKSAHGRAMFFDLTEALASDAFDLAYAAERCVAHADGQPKNSLYLAIYRVLERVPLDALGSLWLANEQGEVLELRQERLLPASSQRFYLYQELCPVHPLIASKLPPRDFACFITAPRQPLSVPRICFLDLELGQLADDPEHGHGADLYYPDHLWHLRQCLLELQRQDDKHTKTVNRLQQPHFPYHHVKHGFYVADQERMVYYPFPTRAELEGRYYPWWRTVHH